MATANCSRGYGGRSLGFSGRSFHVTSGTIRRTIRVPGTVRRAHSLPSFDPPFLYIHTRYGPVDTYLVSGEGGSASATRAFAKPQAGFVRIARWVAHHLISLISSRLVRLLGIYASGVQRFIRPSRRRYSIRWLNKQLSLTHP